MFLVTIVILSLCSSTIFADPINLTDQTWKEMFKNQWMVEFYAPWCPACQHFQSTWKDFSKLMSKKNIHVAAVDIEQHPSLSSRFRITALPTIFYVRDGLVRQYSGDRSLHALKDFIEQEKWKEIEPVSPYFAPDGILISLMSFLFEMTLMLKNAYNFLEESYGWPAWLIYIVFALTIGILGLGVGFAVVGLGELIIGRLSRKSTTESRPTKDHDSDNDEPAQATSSDTPDQTIRQRRAHD